MHPSSFSCRPLARTLAATALFAVSLSRVQATEFSLRERQPGPGHRLTSYWWTFNKASWELTPPEGFSLLGGGELRLSKTDQPGLTAVCRPSTGDETALLGKDDPKAQAAYFRTLLPGGVTDVKLVSQGKNPLPVNGISNFEVVYSYALGGMIYQACYMVSQGGDDTEQSPPVPGKPTPPPTPTPAPGPDGKPVRHGEFFTAMIACPQENYAVLYNGFQQLLATARVKPGEPSSDSSDQYVSHGMLGR